MDKSPFKKEIIAKLVGTIEGFEGTFECMVYVDPEPRNSKPIGYVIGSALRTVE